MEISLHFDIKYDLELIERNITLPVIRLYGLLEFRHQNSWSDLYHAIIDTGSPVSIFPAYIQKECDTQLLHQTKISGLVPDEKCNLSAKLVNMTFRLRDKDRASKPIRSKAYLADTDKIPLILGFATVLEQAQLIVNYPEKKALLSLSD